MDKSSRQKKIDDLEPDETLYDYMRSLQSFTVKSSFECINDYFNFDTSILYQDVDSKTEMLYDLLINTILPETWWDGIEIKPSTTPNECEAVEAILIDIKSCFSVEKFKERLVNIYQMELKKLLPKKPMSKFFASLPGTSKKFMDKWSMLERRLRESIGRSNNDGDEAFKMIEDDCAKFIETCCSKLYLMKVFTAEEFTVVARALEGYIKQNKSVKLIMIDGLHFL